MYSIVRTICDGAAAVVRRRAALWQVGTAVQASSMRVANTDQQSARSGGRMQHMLSQIRVTAGDGVVLSRVGEFSRRVRVYMDVP